MKEELLIRVLIEKPIMQAYVLTALEIDYYEACSTGYPLKFEASITYMQDCLCEDWENNNFALREPPVDLVDKWNAALELELSAGEDYDGPWTRILHIAKFALD